MMVRVGEHGCLDSVLSSPVDKRAEATCGITPRQTRLRAALYRYHLASRSRLTLDESESGQTGAPAQPLDATSRSLECSLNTPQTYPRWSLASPPPSTNFVPGYGQSGRLVMGKIVALHGSDCKALAFHSRSRPRVKVKATSVGSLALRSHLAVGALSNRFKDIVRADISSPMPF